MIRRNEGRALLYAVHGEVFKPTNLTPYSEIRLICSATKEKKNTFLEKEVIDSLQSRKFGSL